MIAKPDDTNTSPTRTSERTDAEGDDPIATYASLLAADSGLPDDLDDLVGPTFWPALSGGDVEAEWGELREWVENLVTRYPHLDHHAIPACWYRHNGHVETLAALRDHERVSFADSSPGTSPAQWHWAFSLIEGRLREWTAQSGCMSAHREPTVRLRPVDDDEWAGWVASDKKRRLARWAGDV